MNSTEKKFMRDFKVLLNKYKVEIEFEYDERNINAYAYSRFDEKGDRISEQIDINFGSYIILED